MINPLRNYRLLPLFLVVFLACSNPDVDEKTTVVQPEFFRPEVALGELFRDVQLADLFPDSKTFADYRPKENPDLILEKYKSSKEQEGFDLMNFVNDNFEPPYSPQPKQLEEFPESIKEHVPAHWDFLTRQPRDEKGISSLIPLPNPYVVPGGRFREIYYWDSYFTMIGLAASNRWDLVENMLDNFAYLIDTIGFIPNGNRTYFLGRSQPPFFSSMVVLFAEGQGMDKAKRYLPQLVKEYDFWMEGANLLNEGNTEYKRVVSPEPGVVLNRYWDNFPEPRPESFKEDYEMAEPLDSASKIQFYRDIRAACESGWDFSSRWFSDGQSLNKIITTQILPVDLNCLLLHLESTIGLLYEESGNQEMANQFMTQSSLRAENIQKYFWDDELGYFQDYNFKTRDFTGILSLAGMYPFYFDIADKDQIERAAQIIKDKFQFDGGLVTTLNNTGQQWDSPNGWPPLQWISIVGLSNYGKDELATEIAESWIRLNEKVYSSTKKMMEKYNVTDLSLEAGGGEYPTQDGFGWTNGVDYRLIQILEESGIIETVVE